MAFRLLLLRKRLLSPTESHSETVERHRSRLALLPCPTHCKILITSESGFLRVVSLRTLLKPSQNSQDIAKASADCFSRTKARHLMRRGMKTLWRPEVKLPDCEVSSRIKG